MYILPEPNTIERHFIQVGERQVHYRKSGSGPAILLFHQSPTSSAELASEVAFFAQHFTVIAPDTPGYGLSSPLPLETPSIADFADAALDLTDALGLTEFGVYGAHTGAMIAAELACRGDRRVAVAVLDGFVVLDEAERTDLLANYFNKPPPSAEGSHLAWAWARIRDQMIFYPWYRKEHAARMKFDVAPAAALQPYLLDMLRAYRGGVPAYCAAFEYDAQHAASTFAVPTYLLNYPADAIADHPERIVSLSPHARREMAADPQALADCAVAIFQAKLSSPAAPSKPVHSKIYLAEFGETSACLHRSGANAPVLLIHQPGASMAQWNAVMAHDAYAWHALDLPGHGKSWASVPDLANFDRDLSNLIRQIGARAVVTIGDSGWLSASAAQSLAIPLLTIDLQAHPRDTPVPDLTPEDHGGHLLKAWYAVRDAELFDPWSSPTLANALDREFDLEPESLTDRTLDLLTAAPWLAMWKEHAIKASKSSPVPAERCVRSGRSADTEVEANTIWPDKQALWADALVNRLRAIL